MTMQIVWGKAAVYNAAGEETILRAGQLVPAWVDDFQRSVLLTAGGGVLVPDAAELEKRLRVAREAEERGYADAPAPEPVRKPELPPLTAPQTRGERGALAGEAALRLARDAERRAQVEQAAAAGDETEQARHDQQPEPEVVEPEPPNSNAPRAEWLAFAVAKGMDRGEAEKLSIPQIKDRFLPK